MFLTIAAGVAIGLGLVVLLLVLVAVWRTRTPAPPQDRPVRLLRPPAVDPLSAGILLNLPRRAMGAAVLDLAARGHVAIDTESGPTRFRIRFVRDVPLADGTRDDVMDALFDSLFSRRHRRPHVDLDRGDRELRGRLRSAGRRAMRTLEREGRLRLLWTRRAFDVANWALIPVGLSVTLVAGVGHAAVMAAIIAAVFLARRRLGWFRTAEGDAIAADLGALRAHLSHDPAAAAAWPAWALLFGIALDDTAWKGLPVSPLLGGGDAGPTGGDPLLALHSELSAEGVGELGGLLDLGGGDLGGDGGGDGGD